MSETQNRSGRRGEKKRLCLYQKHSHIQSIALALTASGSLFSTGTSRDNCDALGNETHCKLAVSFRTISSLE